MTEQEWLACTNPDKMHFFLQRRPASSRKSRLFACACCRQIWHLLRDERNQHLVVVVEKYADGLATIEELNACKEAARNAEETPVIFGTTPLGPALRSTPTAVSLATAEIDRFSPRAVGIIAAEFAAHDCEVDAKPVWDNALQQQSSLLRDIFGNPFRHITFDPRRLTATVKALAESMYDDRRFDQLPNLADAIVEAGCHNAEILSHLRGPGPHVRGCWALDLVLMKN